MYLVFLEKNAEFIRSVGVLAGGTAVAQLIPVLITPVLTRLWSPEAFGGLATYIAVVSILGMVSLGRLDMALMLPKKNDDALRIIEFSLLISITFALLLYFVIGILDFFGPGGTLVIHDWGSALGFMWAMRNERAMKGIAYMEGIVCPVSWADWPDSARGIFKGFRSEKGEDLILNRNMFIEAVLPSSIIRELTDKEMEAYRAPFIEAQDRQPTLNWPRQIPIEGEPAAVVALVEEYGAFMAQSALPKLFINAEPGSILVGKQREFCRSWPNQQEVTVQGLHFIQEDSPIEIGQAVASWLESI